MDPIVRRTQLIYDQIASAYAAKYAHTPSNLAALASLLTQYVGPQGIIADIGCGHGRDLAWLGGGCQLTFGFDLSFQMLVEAKKITKGNLVQMDMQHLAVASASFEGIWCCASLFHLAKSMAAVTLIEFRRIIHRNGMLILFIQEGDSEGWIWNEQDHVERYFARYQTSEICTLLSKAGFATHKQFSWPDALASWLALVCVAM